MEKDNWYMRGGCGKAGYVRFIPWQLSSSSYCKSASSGAERFQGLLMAICSIKTSMEI